MKKLLNIAIIFVLVFTITGCSDQNLLKEQEDTIEELEDMLDDYAQENESLENILEGTDTDYNVLVGERALLEGQIADLLDEQTVLNQEITDLESQLIALQEEETTDDYLEGPWNYELDLISGTNGHINYMIDQNESMSQIVNVIGEDIDMNGEFLEYDQVELGNPDSYESITFKIYGTVYDFEYCNVVWDEDTYVEYELDSIENIGMIRNTEVIIRTMLAETLPYQCVRWTDSQGNEFETFISYDAVGFSGTIILP